MKKIVMNLNAFLKNNPEVLSKYVSLGFNLVDKTVVPLNKLMQHLLEVQGIDPSTQPGENTRKALVNAIDHVEDSEEYDKDFNFSRFHGKYEKIKKHLKHLNLSQAQYLKMTDLSKVDDVYPPLIPQNSDRSELKLFEIERKDKLDPLEDLASFTKEYSPSNFKRVTDLAKEMTKKGLLESNPDAIKSQVKEMLKFSEEALDSLERVVARRAPDTTDKIDAARQPVVVGGTRVTKGKTNVVKSFKNGLFRRVEDK